MDGRVTTLTPEPDPVSPRRPGSRWTGVLLVAAGVAFGYLLAQGTTSGVTSTNTGGVVSSTPATELPPAVVTSAVPVDEGLRFSGSILASVEFGRGLVTWPGDGDPIKIRLASDVWAAAYDAAQVRIAVTLPEYAGDGLALHIGNLGDLRFVTSGVTGFAWHPTDPDAIAWVAGSQDGYRLYEASLSDGVVVATEVAVVRNRVRPVAWGSWGYALQGDDGLTVLGPSGEVLAYAEVQFVAAGSDGRLVVARPAGVPLSSDWAITGPDLMDQAALDRFEDLDEHPTAAAILPLSGRIVLVSNRFGDDADLARIEILAADGTRRAVIRSGMIAESIAWSPDETRLAIGGYYYGSNRVRSVVLLAASDGTGQSVEVPFDHQVRPLGIRD
jgi:hypothetical protein